LATAWDREETIGGGTLSSPAVGPGPTAAAVGTGFILVKNWNFGTNGTIRNIDDLNAHFQYHDHFNTIANPNYGALIVAPDKAHALGSQPLEGVDTGGESIRRFFSDSLRTYLLPLRGATTLSPSARNTGSGSFQATWSLPRGGSRLGQDILWETRVRYLVPRYFWFAIWIVGNQWDQGAEMDLIESFGYDNGHGYTNFDGRYWHSNVIGHTDLVSYGDWGKTMSSLGFPSYDARQYHVWTLLYRKDDSYAFFADGIEVQKGEHYPWTRGAKLDGEPIDLHFLFDATWGSPTVWNDNYPLRAAELKDTYYEWDYSRVYLR
jgi:hypothetical protein